jgi:hypothetical protein
MVWEKVTTYLNVQKKIMSWKWKPVTIYPDRRNHIKLEEKQPSSQIFDKISQYSLMTIFYLGFIIVGEILEIFVD